MEPSVPIPPAAPESRSGVGEAKGGDAQTLDEPPAPMEPASEGIRGVEEAKDGDAQTLDEPPAPMEPAAECSSGVEEANGGDAKVLDEPSASMEPSAECIRCVEVNDRDAIVLDEPPALVEPAVPEAECIRGMEKAKDGDAHVLVQPPAPAPAAECSIRVEEANEDDAQVLDEPPAPMQPSQPTAPLAECSRTVEEANYGVDEPPAPMEPAVPVAEYSDTEEADDGGGSSSSSHFPSPLSDVPVIGDSSLHRVNYLLGELKTGESSETSTSRPTLERSKTERRRQSNPRTDPGVQLYDDKISARKKLKMLNRIATVKDDGTVVVEVPSNVDPTSHDRGSEDVGTEAVDELLESTDIQYMPPLQIVILIVGTRGDVQPFVAIGKRLQDYGHRVRLATHANFKEFVLTAGLEFYPLGGDPKVLAEYMVKNKGFIPSAPSEIPVQRKQIKEIIFSLLAACKDPDVDSGIPFKADAIIANPPAYGHTHVAEALKVPIHIFFTMPWTPTSEFPHPLSRVKQPAGYRLSYQIVDSMIWLGIRGMINDFRKKKLKLRPVTYLSGAQGSASDIPHGYIWSPHLVPKPKDWGPKIDVVGFCFLDLASSYEPPEPLAKWLEAGEKPIYIGFGSLPVQEPEKMTKIIVEALEITGQRGIINKGWGGLGDLAEPKEFVYLLDNVPHDWLFLQCKAVVHHGGAGTTAAGLRAARPTTVVPFFGDQPFWGDRVHDRGVGPPPIPVDQFTLPKLVDAIKFMLDPKVKEQAVELAKSMEYEDGVTGAVKAFLKHLPPRVEGHQAASPPSGIFDSCLRPVRRCFGCS